jgi:hypothetical protein
MNIQKQHGMREMHKPIIVILGVWVLFLLSFWVAWYRVAKSEKFSGEPFHSFELEEPVLNQPIFFDSTLSD